MFKALMEGRFPQRRHDGSEWAPDDPLGDHRVMARKSILLWIKGDWSEHNKTLGLSGRASKYNPCQFCTLCKDELHSLNQCCSMGHSDVPLWPLRGHEEYESACRRCEVDLVCTTAAERKMVSDSIEWAPKKARRGPTVIRDVVIGGVALKIGDRLEPSPSLLDIAGLPRAALPLRATFWRARRGERDGVVLDPILHRSQGAGMRRGRGIG